MEEEIYDLWVLKFSLNVSNAYDRAEEEKEEEEEVVVVVEEDLIFSRHFVFRRLWRISSSSTLSLLSSSTSFRSGGWQGGETERAETTLEARRIALVKSLYKT